jgi:hypothetical protein
VKQGILFLAISSLCGPTRREREAHHGCWVRHVPVLQRAIQAAGFSPEPRRFLVSETSIPIYLMSRLIQLPPWGKDHSRPTESFPQGTVPFFSSFF